MFFHCLLLPDLLSGYEAGTQKEHFFFFLIKNFVFKPEAYLLLINKPHFPASSHVLLQKPVSPLFTDPESWLPPSPTSFPGVIALKRSCFFSQSAQILTALQSTPSDVKSFMTTPRPKSFSLAYFIISDIDLFAHTETMKRKSRELIQLFNSIWKRNLKEFVQGKK